MFIKKYQDSEFLVYKIEDIYLTLSSNVGTQAIIYI